MKRNQHRGRLRPEGCWSFCTEDCALEAAGACRESIPEFELPPPNEGQARIDQLVFGKADYEEERIAYYKQHKGNYLQCDPFGWRPANDPHALKPVYIDLQEADKPAWWQAPALWCPDLFEEMLCEYPPVVDAVYQTVGYKYNPVAMRQLEAVLLRFFRTDYRAAFEQSEKGRAALEHWQDKWWPRAHDLFGRAVGLIAEWCIAQVYDDEVKWAGLFGRYANLGADWREKLQAIQEGRANQKLSFRFKTKKIKEAEAKLSSGNSSSNDVESEARSDYKPTVSFRPRRRAQPESRPESEPDTV